MHVTLTLMRSETIHTNSMNDTFRSPCRYILEGSALEQPVYNKRRSSRFISKVEENEDTV